jgi:hypothetical protein
MNGRRWIRVVLWLLAASAVLVGGWAQLAPRSFYDDFPGAGRHWVSVDGAYNEHLVRDVGGLNLALAVVTILAAVWLTRSLVQAASGAWLVYSVPHLVYHAVNLDAYRAFDKFGNMVSLGLAVVAPLALLVATANRRGDPVPSP